MLYVEKAAKKRKLRLEFCHIYIVKSMFVYIFFTYTIDNAMSVSLFVCVCVIWLRCCHHSRIYASICGMIMVDFAISMSNAAQAYAV